MPIRFEEIKAVLDLYGYRDIDTRIHIAELVLHLDSVWFEPVIEKIKKERSLNKQKELGSKEKIDGKAPISNRRISG